VHGAPLLQDVVILLLASLPVVFVCQKVGLPALVGFLLTGIAIGPSAAGLIHAPENVEVLAELGVALLLFTIGLEFSLARLARLGRIIVGAGALQMSATGLVFAGIAAVAGYHVSEAVLLGMVVALSSTAVVLKILADRAELHATHGQLSLSILLFQDISILPLLLFLPFLDASRQVGAGDVLETLAVALLATAGIIVAARRILPAVFRQVLRLRSQELFIGVVVLSCFGTAWLAASLGVSIAIGAFIAGLVVSESEYSHQVVAEILPLRDLFSSIFFVSIGMLLDLDFIATHATQVAVLLAAIIVVKTLTGAVAVRPFSASPRVAVLVGATIAQVGEFSFVLADEARKLGVLMPESFQGVLAASVFSMVLTPLVGGAASRFLRDYDVPGFDPEPATGGDDEGAVPTKSHVVIIGYGLAGRNLARVLRETGIPSCIVDFDPEQIDQAEQDGHTAVYGDATRSVVLRHVHADTAVAIVVAVGDPAATRRVVAITRDSNPKAAIIVRTRYLSEIEELYRLGASEVVPEELETSVEMFARVLECLDIPKNVIGAQVEVIRAENYAMLRETGASERHLESIYDVFMAATTVTYLVRSGSPAVGHKLAELDIRAKTGASIVAVVRDGSAITNPGADFEISSRDILVMLGNHGELAESRGLLDPPADP